MYGIWGACGGRSPGFISHVTAALVLNTQYAHFALHILSQQQQCHWAQPGTPQLRFEAIVWYDLLCFHHSYEVFHSSWNTMFSLWNPDLLGSYHHHSSTCKCLIVLGLYCDRLPDFGKAFVIYCVEVEGSSVVRGQCEEVISYFWSQGSNSGRCSCRQVPLPLSHLGSPECLIFKITVWVVDLMTLNKNYSMNFGLD